MFTKIPLLFSYAIFSLIVYLLGTIFVLYAPLTKQILENRIDIFRKQNFSFLKIILDFRNTNLDNRIATDRKQNTHL